VQPVEQRIADVIASTIPLVIGRPWDKPVPVEVSNRPDLGDYASPVAFALAPIVGQPPMALSIRLAEALSAAAPGFIAAVEPAAPAFLNIRLADELFYELLVHVHEVEGAIADQTNARPAKVVIEHTNINPNKAAHVGHFRNACLGDTIARILRRLGDEVEVQNYIDDTGVQVADIVVGLQHLGREVPADVPLDRFASEIYVAVQDAYERQPELLARRAETQAAIESGQGELAAFAADIAARIAAANLRTMARAGIGYDLLTWESHILALGFWERAFELLRERDAIRLEGSGPNAGCWVIPFGLGTVDVVGGTVTEDKVLVTSRGIATYTAKDIAYQLWKFGLLGRDFRYRRWGTGPRGDVIWTTTTGAGEEAAPSFARADRVINVIDVTQSYPQKVVYHSLAAMGFDDAARSSEHLAYAVVALSPNAARELGIEPEADDDAVAMSGRRGIQVLADDLLDRLEERMADRTVDPNSAAMVAVGAARYYMLKFSTGQPIAFDFDDALRTTGETGVYLQYAHVRASGILRRLRAAGLSPAPAPPPRPLPAADRRLALKLADYPRALSTAGEDRSVQVLAKYAFDLAATFSAFYDNTPPVVAEQDAVVRAWRAGLVSAFRLVLGDVLDVLGIPTPERL
jgi:arginyl-tRNA synthetase